ncbi:MAG: hypothetical protein AAF919_02150 [Pseudomonadota bacterium]
MKGLVFVLTLALASPAAAHTRLDISPDYDPEILWLDAPNAASLGNARIRLVYHGREAVAALTPNQYWYYSQAYRRSMARLALRMPVHHAEPRARHAAFRAVLGRYPNLNVQGLNLEDVDGGRIAGGLID